MQHLQRLTVLSNPLGIRVPPYVFATGVHVNRRQAARQHTLGTLLLMVPTNPTIPTTMPCAAFYPLTSMPFAPLAPLAPFLAFYA